MVKAIHRGQAKPDDPIYNRGYTIAAQPLKQKPEAKAAPKKRAGKSAGPIVIRTLAR